MITAEAPAHQTIPAPRTILPAPERLAEHVREVDHRGYTVIPGFLDPATCARLRAHIDQCIAARPDGQRGASTYHLRHPIPGAIMASVVTDDHRALARALLRSDDDLRLIEQVLMRTDPGAVEAPRWHLDGVFYPRHRTARPRQTYHFLWHVLSDLEPGGGGTMILPYSQHLAYAASARLADPVEPFAIGDQMAELRSAITTTAGFDLRGAVELTARAGDLIVIDPTCLHTASTNSRMQARYVLQQSFCHAGSSELLAFLARSYCWNEPFPDSLRDHLPERHRDLLKR